MIITGNPETGVAQALYKLYPEATYCSRNSGYDLVETEGMEKFSQAAIQHDVIVLNSALWRFHQTVLLDTVYKSLKDAKKLAHIVVIGSTTDRVKNGKAWLYNAEKKALRDYSNTLSIGGVWSRMPKVSYISFGTLSNNEHKHPDRRCMAIDTAADYIKWIIDQPAHININELSVDPVQDAYWYAL